MLQRSAEGFQLSWAAVNLPNDARASSAISFASRTKTSRSLITKLVYGDFVPNTTETTNAQFNVSIFPRRLKLLHNRLLFGCLPACSQALRKSEQCAPIPMMPPQLLTKNFLRG